MATASFYAFLDGQTSLQHLHTLLNTLGDRLVAVCFLSVSPLLAAQQELLQKAGCAVLLLDDAQKVVKLHLDGVHLSRLDTTEPTARALHPSYQVGCGALLTRDEALDAAEAGADYILFGHIGTTEVAASAETVAWWHFATTVPCVALATTPADLAALNKAGADFIALHTIIAENTFSLPHLKEMLTA